MDTHAGLLRTVRTWGAGQLARGVHIRHARGTRTRAAWRTVRTACTWRLHLPGGCCGRGLVTLFSPHLEDGADEATRAPFRNAIRLCSSFSQHVRTSGAGPEQVKQLLDAICAGRDPSAEGDSEAAATPHAPPSAPPPPSPPPPPPPPPPSAPSSPPPSAPPSPPPSAPPSPRRLPPTVCSPGVGRVGCSLPSPPPTPGARSSSFVCEVLIKY